MLKIFEKLNLKKNKCKCGLIFWSLNDILCGDCDPEDKKKYEKNYKPFNLTIIEFYNEILNYFKNLNYKIDDTDTLRSTLTNISYINAGIVKYKPIFTNNLTRPNSILKRCSIHFCLRFNDLNLVGDSTHLTSFMMWGQHVFNIHEFYKFENYFLDLYTFINKYIPLELLKFHESEWTDYNTQGKSIEFYSNGIELLNQVYTTHNYDSFKYETKLENMFLDMGAGFERIYGYITKTDLNYFYNTQNIKIYDYIKTLLIANLSGIYCSKTGVGYNLRVILRKLINLNITYIIFEQKYLEIYTFLVKFNTFKLNSDITILLKHIKQEYELYKSL